MLLGQSSQGDSSRGDSSGRYDGGEIRLSSAFSGFVEIAPNNAAPRDDIARHPYVGSGGEGKDDHLGYSGSHGQEIMHAGSRNEMSEPEGASPTQSSDYR